MQGLQSMDIRAYGCVKVDTWICGNQYTKYGQDTIVVFGRLQVE